MISNLISAMGETWKVIEGNGSGREQHVIIICQMSGLLLVVDKKSVCSCPQTLAWLVITCIFSHQTPPPEDLER